MRPITRGEIGRITSIRVDTSRMIEIGHYVITQTTGRIWEVVRVHRQQTGKRAGRYELRGRYAAAVPAGAAVHVVRNDNTIGALVEVA